MTSDFQLPFLYLILLRYYALAAVNFTQFRFFYLTGGITGYVCEDDLTGALIAGQISTEVHYVLLGEGMTLFYLDNSGGYLT